MSRPTLALDLTRRFAPVYVLSLFAFTTLLAVLNARNRPHPWITADWLINYQAGFVRRGLVGELLFHLARVSQISLVRLTAGLQIVLSAGFALSLLSSLRRVRWSLELLALFVSPATLAFTVLDPPAAHRKEVLLYLSLALLLGLFRSERTRPWHVALFLSAAVPLLVLSHEAVLFYLPYLFAPIFLAQSRRVALAVCLVPASLGVLAVVAIASHPATLAQSARICTSIGSTLQPDGTGSCGGAILYLARTPAYAHADAVRAAHTYHYPTRYPVPALLSVLPVAFLFRRLLSARERGAAVALGCATAISLFASTFLFVFARDWGRWLHIHLVCLLLLFFHVSRSPARQTGSGPDISDGDGEDHRLSRAAVFGLVLYATCWTLPALGNYPGRFGYLDLVRYLGSYRTSPHIRTDN